MFTFLLDDFFKHGKHTYVHRKPTGKANALVDLYNAKCMNATK